MRKIGLWCNGNTTDSGPVFPGSNPGSPTRSFPHGEGSFFYAWRLIPRRRANGFLSFPGILQKDLSSFRLYRKSFKTSILCPEGCTGHLSAEAFPFFMEDGKRPSLKGLFFLRQTIFQSQANDFPFCGKRFFNLRQTKNHSAEIEKSFGAEKYVQMRPFLIHYQTIS